jgi:hypothetical protein
VNLDALERQLWAIPDSETHIWFEVGVGLKLIQRLREAEELSAARRERAELLLKAKNNWMDRVVAAEARIAQLERVREAAADTWIDSPIEVWVELLAALAALEPA